MENATPFLVLFGNCCVMPLLFMWLGYAFARGWIRSPIALPRRGTAARAMDDDALFDDP